MAKVRRGGDVYARLVKRRNREGLTWAEAARVGGVPLSTLTMWARRLHEVPVEARRRRRAAFVEIATRGDAAPVDRVEIVLRSGRRLLVPWRADALADLVAVLERPC